jgi:hypothetical protein
MLERVLNGGGIANPRLGSILLYLFVQIWTANLYANGCKLARANETKTWLPTFLAGSFGLDRTKSNKDTGEFRDEEI